MSKKYYLVTKTTLFVDPHGSPDNGGTEKSVEYTDEYNDLDPDLVYNDELEPVDDDDDEYYQGSEDGYNSEYIEYQFRELTEEEAIQAKITIQEYNKL